MLNRCVQHAGEANIDAEFRRAVHFFRGVHALGGLADNGPLAGVLELYFLGRRKLRGGLSQTAKGRGPLGCWVHNRAAFDMALGRLHRPLLRGGGDEHLARRGASLAHGVPGGVNALATAGALHAERGVEVNLRGRSEFGADAFPIAAELFGGQHGDRSFDALAHLGFVDQDGDCVVRGDLDERVENTRLRRRRGGENFAAARQIETDDEAGYAGDSGFEEAAAVDGIRDGGHSAPPARTSSESGAGSASALGLVPAAGFVAAACSAAA